MEAKIEIGSTVFIIESNRIILEAAVIAQQGDFYTIRFRDGGGGIRLRRSRLFLTHEDAEGSLPICPQPQRKYRSPYDYGI